MKRTGCTFRRSGGAALIFLWLWTAPAAADVITGADWRVVFNRPDQTTTLTSIGANEFDIREAFVERIEALGAGDHGYLATYTLTGGYEANGAAGPILTSVSNALARGAHMGFIVGNGVDMADEFQPGCSLDLLSRRPGNALEVARAPSTGIMHHKVGVFFYHGTGESRLLSASWNFTAWASSRQWNILADFANRDLALAYSNELRQLLNGFFHSNPAKSRIPHDKASFRTAESEEDGWTRFAPYPSGRTGGDNAQTEITNRIAGARQSIWFALNKQTRAAVTDQLIAACDRGVAVHGVIPRSDRDNVSAASHGQYQRMLDASEYATTNRIQFHEAYTKSTSTEEYDNGLSDLVHCKYMVIDPFGESPWVVHGSANWTLTALATTNTAYSNDENILFIPDGGIARAFLSQFEAMTGIEAVEPEPGGGVRLAMVPASGGRSELRFTLPEGVSGVLVGTADPRDWSPPTWSRPVGAGIHAIALTNGASRMFYRIEAGAPSGSSRSPAGPAPCRGSGGGAQLRTNGVLLEVTLAPETLTAHGEGGVEYTVSAEVANDTGLDITRAEWSVVPADGMTNGFAGAQAEDGDTLVLVPAPEDGGREFDIGYLVVAGEGDGSVTNSAVCRLTVLNPRRVDFETLGPFSSYPTNTAVDEATGLPDYIGVTTNLNGMDWMLFNLRRTEANSLGMYSARLRHSSSTLPGFLESRGWFSGLGSISVNYMLYSTTGFLTFVIEVKEAESDEWLPVGDPCRVEAGGDISNQMYTVDVNRPGRHRVRLRTTGGYGRVVNLDNLVIRPHGDLVPVLEVDGASAAAIGREYELRFRLLNAEGAPRVWSDYGAAAADAGAAPVVEEADGDLRLAFTPALEDAGRTFTATGTVSVYGGQYVYSTSWTFTVASAPGFELWNASPEGRTVLYTNEILDVWSTNVFLGGEPCANSDAYEARWTACPPFVTNTVSQYNRYRIGGGLLAADIGNHELFLTLTDTSNGLATTHSLHFLVRDRETPDPRHLHFEDFAEIGFDPRTATLSGGGWDLAGVRAGWDPGDARIGTTAARIQCPGTGAAFLESRDTFDGIGYIEFACAGHAGTEGGAVQVQVQAEGEAEFRPVGAAAVPTADLTRHRVYAGVETSARVRLEVSGPAGSLINVDEVSLGAFRPEERIEVEGALEIPAGGGFDLRFVPADLAAGVTAEGIEVLRNGWEVTQYDDETPRFALTTEEEAGGRAGEFLIRIPLSSGYWLETNVTWTVRAAAGPRIEDFQPGSLSVWGLAGWSRVVFAVTNLTGDAAQSANWVWAVTNLHAADGVEEIELPAAADPPAAGRRILFYGVKTQ